MIPVRLRYRHWIPRLIGVDAIVLYPYVLFTGAKEGIAPLLLKHEMIHVRQVRREGWAGFYARYLKEYFSLRLKGKNRNEAYRNISFEQEAYELAGAVELSEMEKKEVGVG